jgi:hypothetical protein
MAEEPAPIEAVPFEVTPNAVPDCRRTAVGARLPAAKAAALPAGEGLPSVERRTGIHPNEARAPMPAVALPAAAAGLPSAEQRSGIHPNAAPAPVPALPGRPSSVRHPNFDRCFPATNLANAAAPGRQKPAKPIASAPIRWSEVWQSYSSPEQQCCHETTYIFLRKVTNFHSLGCGVSPGAGAAGDARRGQLY